MAPDEPNRPIADEVLPAQIDDLAVPVALDKLFPWHRPRKQLVREKQWIHFSRQLIEREKGQPGLRGSPNANPEVRFLTLPGIDYLDVRQLADVCQDLGCSLTSIGFQSGGEQNAYVARAQLREKSLIDAKRITSQSHTFPRRLEDIVSTSSQAYQELKERGPFHIVNIDACGSIAAPRADHPNRLIEAVYRIVELQLELMTGRWLLFVTTDVRPGSVARETRDRLYNTIFENADKNEEFRNRAVPFLAPGEVDIRAAVRTASARPGITSLQLFSLGLAKWFIHLARDKNWDMQTHHPYCYSTMPGNNNTPSMTCLAFEFLPPSPGLQDRFQVARAEPAPASGREDTSVRAADKIRDMTNADSKIGSDEPLRNRMVEDLRMLLAEVGYSSTLLDEIGA